MLSSYSPDGTKVDEMTEQVDDIVFRKKKSIRYLAVPKESAKYL